MEYGRDNKFSFWRRLTSGGFGPKKREPISARRDDHVYSSTAPPSGASLNYSLRRSVSRERELPTPTPRPSHPPAADRTAFSDLPSKQSQQLNFSDRGGRREAEFTSSSRHLRPSGVAERAAHSTIRSRETPDRSEPSYRDRSQREGSYPRLGYANNIRNSTEYLSKRSSAGISELLRGNNSSSTSERPRRGSLQFYYDPGKYSTPSAERDYTGVRSIYTRSLSSSSDAISGSGRRAPSSSTYRPLVYTPGSPSPLRRSWAGATDSSSSTDKDMASFMAIGRNSVFPDFLSSKSSQHGHATPAYQDSSQESGLEGFKQKTLRLFGNNNISQKSSSNRSAYTKGSPVSSKKSYQGSSSSQSSSHKGGTNGNGNGGSRSIYRQPSSISNRSGGTRNQSADLRRKYFSQRMMWYSEADEDHIDPEFDRNFEKRHHSAMELGSVSHADLLRSDSVQSSSTSSQESIDRERSLVTRRPRPSVLKSASFDYYDNLDYRDTRGLRETSPANSRGQRRLSGGSVQRLTKQPSLQRQRSKQRTRFSDEVAVVYYDQEDKATALSGGDTVREQEKLKDDKTSSSTVTESTIRLSCNLHPGQMCGYNNLARILSNPVNTAEQEQEIQNSKNDHETTAMTTASEKIAALGLTDHIDTEGNMVRKSVFVDKNFEIIEAEGSHELKLVVPIGPEFIRNRTSVKATSGGKRLIVIAYRNEGEGDLAHVHQYIEKMTLPHPIDAYSVRATMDREGNLKISAPMSIIGDQNNTTPKTTNEN